MVVGLVAVAHGAPRVSLGASRWRDERHDNGFFWHADFSLEQEPAALQAVRDLRAELQRELQLPDLRSDVHLFLFAREKTYEQYLAAYFPRLPRRPAHYVRERGPGMILAVRGAQLVTDLRHEVTHALLHDQHQGLPLWLDEGLAEYFERPAAERRAGNPDFDAARLAASRGRPPRPLDELEGWSHPGKLNADDYRLAWSWVQFLLEGPPAARIELMRYLQACRSIEQPLVSGPLSLARRLRQRWPQLENEYQRYWQSLS